MLLGSTRISGALSPGVDPPGSKSDLRFVVPNIEPGRYTFVIFCAECARGPRGSLIVDTSSGKLLRILPSEAAMRAGGRFRERFLWIVTGIGTIALVLAALLLLRRRRAA